MSERPERRLYLIRHAKASHSSMGELDTPRGLVADPPLDDVGREQVEILTRRLLKMPRPAALYVSPLARARQTVALFERQSGMSAAVVDDLAEWFGGDWEFKEFEELIGEHPDMPNRVLMQDPVFELAPGAESKAEFQGRVVPAVEAALASHPGGDVWIVCHGGVINAYLSHILGLHPRQELFFLPPNTSLNTLRVIGEERFVWFIADDTHITQPELYADR
ncbi:MAG: histidine phosphatase family protein [Actinomycetota bacterium]